MQNDVLFQHLTILLKKVDLRTVMSSATLNCMLEMGLYPLYTIYPPRKMKAKTAC